MSEYLDYDEAVRANRARKKKAMAMKRKRQAQIRLIKRNLFAAILLLVISVVVTKSVKAISSRADDSNAQQQASVAGFSVDEEVTANDLLYGLALPSGADAAYGIAQITAGSEEEFVKLMNEKCEEMGLKNTHFCNPSGLHDVNQYTTPAEMAMIMEYAMSNEVCAKVLGTYQYTTASTPQHPDGIHLTSTMFSRMVGNEVPGVTIKAGKTGYTDEAHNCLVNFAEKDGKEYVTVMAAAGNRWYVIFDGFKIYERYLP